MKSLTLIKSKLIRDMREQKVYEKTKDHINEAFININKITTPRKIYNNKAKALVKARNIIKFQKFLIGQTWSIIKALGMDAKKFRLNIEKKYKQKAKDIYSRYSIHKE